MKTEPSNRNGINRHPLTMMIFGATGDLTHRKLLPAAYHLMAEGRLPRDTAIIAIGRRDKDDTIYREEARRSITTQATSPAMTSETEARRSVAMTGAPFSRSTPSILAVWPESEIFAPRRARSRAPSAWATTRCARSASAATSRAMRRAPTA